MSDLCDEALANLYVYIDRELDEAEMSRIRRHLEDCPPCGRTFDFEARLKLVVRERLQEDVPQSLVNRIHSALHPGHSPT